jgi:hypothetical protein
MIYKKLRSSLNISNFQLSTEHFRQCPAAFARLRKNNSNLGKLPMRPKIQTTKNSSTLALNKRGVFRISTAPNGHRNREKIAELICLRAIGENENGVTLAQIEFRTRHGANRVEFFPWSTLLPENRNTIKFTLADRGYEWPREAKLSSEILDALDGTQPKEKFLRVRAPGWYGAVYSIPDQAFAKEESDLKVFIDDRESDAHVGAFILGDGSLKDW